MYEWMIYSLMLWMIYLWMNDIQILIINVGATITEWDDNGLIIIRIRIVIRIIYFSEQISVIKSSNPWQRTLAWRIKHIYVIIVISTLCHSESNLLNLCRWNYTLEITIKVYLSISIYLFITFIIIYYFLSSLNIILPMMLDKYLRIFNKL